MRRYVAEVLEYVYRHRKQVSGYKITWAPAVLRHFSAHLEPISTSEKREEIKDEEEDEDEELDEMEEFKSRVRGMSFRRSSLQFIWATNTDWDLNEHFSLDSHRAIYYIDNLGSTPISK